MLTRRLTGLATWHIFLPSSAEIAHDLPNCTSDLHYHGRCRDHDFPQRPGQMALNLRQVSFRYDTLHPQVDRLRVFCWLVKLEMRFEISN
jgi:hypothetical protein